MKSKIFIGIVAAMVIAVSAEGADKVRIGVSNYNLSNLTVGALNEVSDINPLREAQRELGIPHLYPPPHRGGGMLTRTNC
jgi:hypothetical protein